jgi:hypothetical protein
MRNIPIGASLILVMGVSVFSQPVRLHPDNHRYFLFKDGPAVLITSGEHYGSVLNLDFDFIKYLETLASDGLNGTRLFSGAYFEPQGAFGIEKNTLAPVRGRALVPWARTGVSGNMGGGNKFDLSRWDGDYFARLRKFVGEADRRGVVVELTLFSSVYSDGNWEINPLNPSNNVNDIKVTDRFSLHTSGNGALLAVQEAFVRKTVRELNGFENLYYGIQNEPWADHPDSAGVTNPYLFPLDFRWTGQFWKNRVDLANGESLAWQKQAASWITDEESNLPNRHLIAQDYCNFRFPLEDVDPDVSILNFHYAWPEAVAMNAGWNRPVAFGETGFAGSADAVYRRQAWRFILSGGAVFSGLDYSFAVGGEDGTAENRAPGGGSPALRRQLGVLKKFMKGLDFVRMKPDVSFVLKSPGLLVRGLSDPGRSYALYMEGRKPAAITLGLPSGSYVAEWIDPESGWTVLRLNWEQGKTPGNMPCPDFAGEIALRIAVSSPGIH